MSSSDQLDSLPRPILRLRRELLKFGAKDFKVHQQGDQALYDVIVTPELLLPIVTELKESHAFFFLLDIIGRDIRFKEGEDDDFETKYLLLNLETHTRLMVSVRISQGEALSSLSSVWFNAAILEAEVSQGFGISFHGQAESPELTSWPDGSFYPLRKDHDCERAPAAKEPSSLFFENIYGLNYEERAGKTWYEVGPLHPATDTGYRLIVELEGQKVCRSKVEFGYNYRGVEKKCEKLPLRFLPDAAEEMSSSLGVSHALTALHCFEKILDVEVPDRAKAIRMVFLELERIYEHCLTLSRMCKTIQLVSGWETFLYCREILDHLLSQVNGHSHSLKIHRFGGVQFDVDRSWTFESLSLLKQLENKLDLWRKLLTRNRLWMERTDVGHLLATDAVYAGIGGPLLRSCGVNYDLRKVSPYYFYNEVRFDVPLGINGRVYDRYLVMMEEIKQSLSIIQQLLENIPQGQVLNEEYESWHYQKNWRIPEGTYYAFHEAPLGEFGVMIHSDGGSHAERVKFRSPSLATSSMISHLLKNEELEDGLVLLSSLSMNMGELER